MTTIIRFSYVIPIYNEEAVLPYLFRELSKFLERTPVKGVTEVVLVDDGSSDASWALIADKAANDKRFVAVRLSRNFGHQFALTAGYFVARGDAIICMDADLQDPPEVTLGFIQKWEEGYDIVFGVRREREGETFFKVVTAKIFYYLIAALGETRVPKNTGDFRLLSRCALDALKRLPERHRYLRGLVGWIGFKSTKIEYDRRPRVAGKTKYPLRKMLNLAADAVVSMSSKPLRFSYYAAALATALFLGFLLLNLVKALLFGIKMVPGWSSLIVSIVAFGALNLICLGLIGEYVGRIYEEVKRRPLFFIQEVIREGKDEGDFVIKL